MNLYTCSESLQLGHGVMIMGTNHSEGDILWGQFFCHTLAGRMTTSITRFVFVSVCMCLCTHIMLKFLISQWSALKSRLFPRVPYTTMLSFSPRFAMATCGDKNYASVWLVHTSQRSRVSTDLFDQSPDVELEKSSVD